MWLTPVMNLVHKVLSYIKLLDRCIKEFIFLNKVNFCLFGLVCWVFFCKN